jgi:hypothetical protein
MSGYSFSQVYHASQVAFSPGTTFLATLHQNRLIIRQTSTLQVIRSFTIHPRSPSTYIATSTSHLSRSLASSSSSKPQEITLDHLQWSNDSLYISVFSKASSSVWIFSLTEEGNGEDGEVAQISSVKRVEWGRGRMGRDILIWGKLGVSCKNAQCLQADSVQLDLRIFNLTTGIARIIQHPKSTSNCMSYIFEPPLQLKWG